MMKYDHLLGRQFVLGKTDCFGLARDFYLDNFQIDIPNFARPTDWWGKGLNLFADIFPELGFGVASDNPLFWRPGDIILAAIEARVPNHIAVVVDDGRILHHMPRRLSIVEPYKGLVRNCTVGVIRHRDVPDISTVGQLSDLMEHLPYGLRQKLASVQTPAGGPAGEGGFRFDEWVNRGS